MTSVEVKSLFTETKKGKRTVSIEVFQHERKMRIEALAALENETVLFNTSMRYFSIHSEVIRKAYSFIVKNGLLDQFKEYVEHYKYEKSHDDSVWLSKTTKYWDDYSFIERKGKELSQIEKKYFIGKKK